MERKFFTNLLRLIFDRTNGDIIMSNSTLGQSCVTLHHKQNVESDCWDIKHKFDNSKAIVNVFHDTGNGEYEIVIPDTITYLNNGHIKVEFATPISGFANILFMCDSSTINVI